MAVVPVTLVRIDARRWQTAADLWADLLPALGAPDRHGSTLDALFDSLVARLNRVRPPMIVELNGAAQAGPAAIAYMTRIREVFDDAAAELGEPVTLRIA